METKDDNSLTIAYMCGYNDAKRSTVPEGCPPHAEIYVGDMRLKDGKLWMCTDPDIDRWVCPDDRGWQLVPVEPDWDMEMEGIKELIGCTDGELECIDVNSLDGYISEVNEIFSAMLSAAPKFGEEE